MAKKKTVKKSNPTAEPTEPTRTNPRVVSGLATASQKLQEAKDELVMIGEYDHAATIREVIADIGSRVIQIGDIRDSTGRWTITELSKVRE